MSQTQEVRQDYRRYIANTSKAVLEARAVKRAAKEALDAELEEDSEYAKILAEAEDVRIRKKTLKNKLISENSKIQKLNEQYVEKRDAVKDAEVSLNGALEAHFVETGEATITLEGDVEIVMNRKYSLGQKQMSLFEQMPLFNS